MAVAFLHGAPAAAIPASLQEQGDTISPSQRFEAAMDTIARLDSAIIAIDQWDVGRDGVDGRLLDERRKVRVDRRRELLWRLAQAAPALPPGDEREARIALADSLLVADAIELIDQIEGGLEEASRLGAEVVDLEGAARARMEGRIQEIDQLIDDGLVDFNASLIRRDSLGLVPVSWQGLDLVLGIRAELLAGRMAIAESEIASIRARIARGVEGLDEEIAALDLRINETADALENVLELMEDRDLPTADYRRYLLVSTRELSADNLNVEVVSGLAAEWVSQAGAWIRENGATVLLKIIVFLGILVLARIVAGVVNRIVVGALNTSHLEISSLLRDTIIRWSTRIVMLLGLLIALSQIGVELGPVLAGLGVAGFVIGFALQDTLSNFAAGVMILLYRPFDVADVVEVGGVVGKVADMSLVSTTILSADNQRYIVPNSQIWGNVIQNVTAEDIRRVDMVIGIGYEDDIPEAERILQEIVDQHELVLDEPAPLIKLSELGDSSVNFVVRPWCRTSDYWDVRFDITRLVKLRFDEEGISIPFPQRDIRVIHQSGDSQNGGHGAAVAAGTAAGESGSGRVGGIMRGEESDAEADQTPD